MKYYSEPSRLIPIKHEVDVLVCGARPAGVAAALFAQQATPRAF